MKLLITFTLGISLISFYGCKKEIEPKNGNPTMEPSLLNLSNLPAVNGDRLQFNTWTQYENYLVDLEDEVNLPTTTDEDSVLYHIEQNELGGFYSLRQHINILTGFTSDGLWIDEELEFYGEELNGMEDNACDMIGDPIEKSTINKFYEVQIGDSVYIHFSIGVVLKIHESESATINEIRETEKCSDLPGWIVTNKNITVIVNGETELLAGKCEQTHDGKTYKQETQFIRASCNPKSITAKFTSYQDGSEYNLSYYIINWGDGSPQEQVNNLHSSFFNHTYNSDGSYNIIVSAAYIDHNSNVRTVSDCMNKTIDIDGTMCGTYSDVMFDRVENSEYSISCNFTIRIKRKRNDPSIEKKIQYIAWTRSWKKRNNRWRKKRVTKSVFMCGKIRDASCDIDDVVNKPEPSKKWYTITVRDKKDIPAGGGVRVSNNENYSNHALPVGNLTLTHTMTPCP